jgi:hypothetical protein
MAANLVPFLPGFNPTDSGRIMVIINLYPPINVPIFPVIHYNLVIFYSTGGTWQRYPDDQSIVVEDMTLRAA